MIERLSGLSHLESIEEFWANGNRLQCFDELSELKHCPKLGAVYLECNPWCQNQRYMSIVRDFLPHLRQIDATILKWD